MKIRDILQAKGTEVKTIAAQRSVREAIETLVQYNIGSLLVVEGANVAGIVTERDILRACRNNADRLTSLRIAEIMTSDLIIGRTDDDVENALGVMTAQHIRHLPILNGTELEGIVSIGDLVKSQLDERAVLIRYLKDYITGTNVH